MYSPKDLQALIGLANAKYDMGDTKEAIENYQKVLEIDDEIPDVYYNLANAQYLIKDVEGAI